MCAFGVENSVKVKIVQNNISAFNFSSFISVYHPASFVDLNNFKPLSWNGNYCNLTGNRPNHCEKSSVFAETIKTGPKICLIEEKSPNPFSMLVFFLPVHLVKENLTNSPGRFCPLG